MELESSQSYANFRAWCPRKEVSIGVLHPIPWRYYDWGPKSYPEPIICLHSLIGSAESFYQQIISIASRGYRILSVQVPVYWTVAEFCDAFHSFLETIPHRRLHLYGAGLGGFLAMHYAARKPDRIASLVLTHSFLSTENLKLRIPYSAGVLRWLPDFLIRSTMRAILPKGRVTIDMANAAELAIGHTMACSRDVLASRLALSVTSSTVVNRVHIPETSITLIDSLDRQTNALQLSELTAAQFPNARRALLKTGGDFPYISVPDDINVHLIVHLRRNGADPVPDIPIPVPARPMVLPVATRRRRAERARRIGDSGRRDQSADVTEERQKRRVRSVEELEKEARAIIAADERSKIERHSFEIARLREFLPGRSDVYLAAVLDACEGSLDAAIANALDEQYDDDFYEELFTECLERIITRLREGDQGDKEGSEFSGDDKSGSTRDEEHNCAASEAEDSAIGAAHNLSKENEAEDVISSYKRRGGISEDPLGETSFLENTSKPLDSNEKKPDVEDVDKNAADGDIKVVLSPIPLSAHQKSDSTELRDDEPHDAQKTKQSPISAMSTVDLGVKTLHLNPEAAETPTKGEKVLVNGAKSEVDPDSAKRRDRQSRRKSFPQESDMTDAYVSSGKVGMRSRGPFVGRGPAPFNSAPTESGLSPGEAWVRMPPKKEEEDKGTGLEVEDKTYVSLSSGASLLDAKENPLGLPGDEESYSSRGYNVLPVLGNDGALGRDNQRSKSAGGTPTMSLPEKSGSLPKSPVLHSSGEALLGHSGRLVDVRAPAEPDEWERFRRGEVGLAGVIPVAPVAVERTLNNAFNSTDGEGGTENEDNEAARLREWRMSAQAASKNVHR